MSAVSADDMDRFRQRVVGRSIGQDTFAAYRLWIQRFEMWYDGSDPTLRDLEDFDTYLEDPAQAMYLWENSTGRPAPMSYSHSSRNQAMCAIKMWVRRQYDRNIPEQPGDIVRGEEDPFRPTYLSRERVQDIVQSAGEACACGGCEAALAVSYDAVLRASELVRLTRSDVDLDSGEIDVTATKGSRDSVVVVSQPTIERIRAHADSTGQSGGALFTNTYGDAWKAGSWASHVLNNHVPEGSHAFGRHTPILHQLEAGVAFGDVYRRARHKAPATTARYARHVDVDVPSWAAD